VLFKIYEEGYFFDSDEEFLQLLYIHKNMLKDCEEKYPNFLDIYLKSAAFDTANYRRLLKMMQKLEDTIDEKENTGGFREK
jgi:hypothetical protein